MAGQSKMQLLDLEQEMIVLIISKTTLLHQFTHRRVSKRFKMIIEDYVWLKRKRWSEKDFPGTYYLPMDQICQVMLPKMPHLKKLPINLPLVPGKYDTIIDLASRYCHEVTFSRCVNLEPVKRYLRNLEAQSVPIDHQNFEFYASSNVELHELKDLPDSSPIVLSLDGIDLSYHSWLNLDRICELTCRNLNLSSFEIPLKVTKLDLDDLYDEFLKICHNIKSLHILKESLNDSLNNLKYFNHLSELEIRIISIENDNEDIKKSFCDNLESFLLGNGKTVTHFLLYLLGKYEHLIRKIASMNRDIKWRKLFLTSERVYFIFKNNSLTIRYDGALKCVPETLLLADNCHRVKFISIDDHCMLRITSNRPSKKFSANLNDNQLQSWKSMMMTFSSVRKNSKIELELLVNNPDEDNIISGDNWIITQVKSPMWYKPLLERDNNCCSTIRARKLLESWFKY